MDGEFGIINNLIISEISRMNEKNSISYFILFYKNGIFLNGFMPKKRLNIEYQNHLIRKFYTNQFDHHPQVLK